MTFILFLLFYLKKKRHLNNKGHKQTLDVLEFRQKDKAELPASQGRQDMTATTNPKDTTTAFLLLSTVYFFYPKNVATFFKHVPEHCGFLVKKLNIWLPR